MKITKSHIIFFTFFMLVISNSSFLVNLNLRKYFEYFTLGLLTFEIIICFFREKKHLKDIKIFIIVTILFSIGLLLQPHLIIATKLRLVLTMIALSSFMILSKSYLNSYKNIRISAYGMLCGLIATFLIGLITNTNVFERVYDNVFIIPLKTAFNAGIKYKNMYSTIVLSIFIGIFLYYKNKEKKKIDLICLVILPFLLLFSVSKGGYIIFEFICTFNLKKVIDKFNFKLKIILFCLVIGGLIIPSSFIYSKFIGTSETYAYRIRGVENYINYIQKDYFHMFFGYSEIAFSKDGNYIENIKIFLKMNGMDGMNGSYEMGFINTLIKNGIIGIIGFVISYIWILKNAFSLKNSCEKKHVICILLVLLVSSLVESYVCNIHQTFGIFCYLTMTGLLYIGSQNQEDSL